ncbi:DOMON domain-containing protein FRRS1L [Camelus ferus]|nr:DOMON domain-containing protein FRRS1L [Camelus ferus]
MMRSRPVNTRGGIRLVPRVLQQLKEIKVEESGVMSGSKNTLKVKILRSTIRGTTCRYGKPGCNAETCDYFLSYRMIGADVEFELSADTDGWVAVGFSSDKKMGGDDVMACVHDDNGRVRIQHFYNVGQWAKEIQRNPARDEEGVFENNRVTCRFKRPVNVPRDETIVDLHLSWYYLFAWGPAIQGSITRHDIDSPPTSERVVSIYKYEDIFMPSAAYQTFSSPFCLLLIVALTFYLLMGTP